MTLYGASWIMHSVSCLYYIVGMASVVGCFSSL
jgi:hypothetical protein